MIPSEADRLVRELYDIVWSAGELTAIDWIVATQYVIHSDPGDQWEGRTIYRATYRERVMYSRAAFPDLLFILNDVISSSTRVSVRWSAEGTQRGDLAGLPATGKRLRFVGQTIYDIVDGQVAGHWQVIDRLGFVQQLRATGA